MTTISHYRLNCDKGEVTQVCLFDSEDGRKECNDFPYLRVHPEGNERLVRFSLDDGSRHRLELPNHGERAPTLWHENGRASYFCSLSRIQPNDEDRIAAMSQTHPQTWTLIQDRLDRRFRGSETFRQRAIDFLTHDDLSDEEMLPFFLTQVSNEACGNYRYRTIPMLSAAGAIVFEDSRHFPAEHQSCVEEQSPSDDEYLKTDRNCFWNTLASFVPQTPFQPRDREPIEVLDVGCGDASSAVPLDDFFGQFHNDEDDLLSRGVHYTGVDVSRKEIEKAAHLNAGRHEVSFVTSGAIEFLKAIPDQRYDVILLRHPGPIRDDYGDNSDMWAEIMRQAYTHLSDQGIMIVTTYFCYEYQFAKYLLGVELGATIYVEGENPSSYHVGLDRDLYLTIFGRQPLECYER